MSTKSNIFYYQMYGRTNALKQRFLAFFYGISSYPRLIAEVFLRRNMGIRYYSLSHSIRIILFMLVAPFLLPASHRESFGHVLGQHWAWFGFIGAFAFFSWKRYLEVRIKHGVYDFNHFGLSAGQRLPFIEKLTINGKPLNPRILTVYVEPLLIGGAGFLFLMLGQGMIATLLLACSFIYSMSYAAAFEMGRQAILEIIDTEICNRSLANIFLNDNPPLGGFEFYGPKPNSAQVRKGIASHLLDDDDEAASLVK